MKEILISIKPKYISQILKGNKTIELRKKVGRFFMPNAEIYLYSSSPVKALVAKARIKDVEKVTLKDLNERKADILKAACISEDDFDVYYNGCDSSYLIYLEGVVLFERPLSLAELRHCGFTPPQSFCYLDNELHSFLVAEGLI